MLADRKDDMGMMIELVVDEETLMARLLNRAIEQGRADDNEETIKKRFDVYRKPDGSFGRVVRERRFAPHFQLERFERTDAGGIFEAIDAANK